MTYDNQEIGIKQDFLGDVRTRLLQGTYREYQILGADRLHADLASTSNRAMDGQRSPIDERPHWQHKYHSLDTTDRLGITISVISVVTTSCSPSLESVTRFIYHIAYASQDSAEKPAYHIYGVEK